MNQNSFSLKNKNSVRQRSLAKNPRRSIGRRQNNRGRGRPRVRQSQPPLRAFLRDYGDGKKQRYRGMAPRMQTANGRTIIKNREFIAALASDTSEGYSDYLINPGTTEMFPWLSTIAPAFDRYAFRRLSFVYKPTAGVTTAGLVMFSIDYDPKDSAYADPAQFENAYNHSESAPYKPMTLPFKPKTAPQGGFYKVAEEAQTTDLDFYYPGRFQTYVQAAAGVVPLGRVVVDYEVELVEPQVTTVVDRSKFNESLYVATLNSTYLDTQTVEFASVIYNKGTVINNFISLGQNFLIPCAGYWIVSMSGDTSPTGSMRPVANDGALTFGLTCYDSNLNNFTYVTSTVAGHFHFVAVGNITTVGEPRPLAIHEIPDFPNSVHRPIIAHQEDIAYRADRTILKEARRKRDEWRKLRFEQTQYDNRIVELSDDDEIDSVTQFEKRKMRPKSKERK